MGSVNSVLAFSSFISMIGSLLVAFTWAYPKQNRSKHGRILLFWLSVADFMSALFYFISAFNIPNDTFCEAVALLDMFFPMASFIWTDIIAYYLYLVVKTRSSKTPYDWSKLLVYFHLLAWGISAIFITIVGAAGQAGRNDADDDAISNTGGWCWIKNTGRRNTFIWELVGGKLVEWASGLVIVPFLYISVACELYQIEKRNYGFTFRESMLFGNRKSGGMKKSPSMPSLKSEGEAVRNIFHSTKVRSNDNKSRMSDFKRERSVSGTDSIDGGKSVKMVETGKAHTHTTNTDGTTMPPFRSESEGDLFSDSEMISNQLFASAKDYDGYESTKSFGSQSHLSEHDLSRNDTMAQHHKQPIGSVDSKERTTSTQSSGKYFTKFYMKLALLPIVFIFIRVWSSLKVILIAVGDPGAGNEVFGSFQTFFDPSQGFFNALLFVLFSKNDRIELITNLKQVWKDIFYCFRKRKPSEHLIEDIESNAQIFRQDGLATANKLRDKLMQNQTMGNVVSNDNDERKEGGGAETKDEEFLNIDDLSDFECDDENRLSNFSFDSRMESVPAPSSSNISNLANAPSN